MMDIKAEIEAEDARKDIDDAPGYTRAQECELSELMLGHLTHRQLANRVRMLMRQDWSHESVVVACRDRIAWLAKRVEDLEAQMSNFEHTKETPDG